EIVLAGPVQPPVAEIQALPEPGPQQRRCVLRLALGAGGVAPRSHLAASQVHDPEAASLRRERHQGSRARQLDVVGMRGDGEDVNRHARSLSRRGGRPPCSRSRLPRATPPPPGGPSPAPRRRTRASGRAAGGNPPPAPPRGGGGSLGFGGGGGGGPSFCPRACRLRSRHGG